MSVKWLVFRIESMAHVTASEGRVVSIVGTVDGENEITALILRQADWEKIVRNADWWRGKGPES